MRCHDLRSYPAPPSSPMSRIGQRAIAQAAAKADARRAEIRKRVAQRARELLEQAAKDRKRSGT